MSNKENRRRLINQYIQSQGTITIEQLAERHNEVSVMTLRRDLEVLEQRGELVRVRGGAKSLSHLSSLQEANYTKRQHENLYGKLLIAEKALSIIKPDQSIYIDSGTTCLTLAKHFPDQSTFVLTPSPNVALELAKNHKIKINLTGGQLNRETLTLSGFNAAEYVKSLNIDVAFMAASGYSLQSDFSCGDYFEAELKRLIIKKARQVVLLMDGSKLDTSLPHTFARLVNVNIWIADTPLPDSIAKAAQRAHTKIM